MAKLDLARTFIKENAGTAPSLNQIIERTGLPRKRLNRGFRKLYGITIRDFIARERIFEAEKLLRNTELSVAEISDMCGFENPNNLTRAFKSARGMTPMDYRRR